MASCSPLEIVERISFAEQQVYDLIKSISVLLKNLNDPDSRNHETFDLLTKKDVVGDVPELTKLVFDLCNKIEASVRCLLDDIFQPNIDWGSDTVVIERENTATIDQKLFLSLWHVSMIREKINGIFSFLDQNISGLSKPD
ncbi:hypothetical protein RF11_15782 [Thelohanellus kitauei]|uniref:Uncharacterized protein n=1 Tax=Thelohanellus kitauei TaxID=669202 RepID=A0A0C2MFL9_THEKT|nr:hypothetical protein RF11_15782 [Thelohanellus kitauei]